MAQQLYLTTGNTRHRVVNDNGENLGTIREFMMDVETGRVVYAILDFKKSLSRTKYFAVPWELLDFSAPEGNFILNIPKATIEKEAGYKRSNQVLEKIDTTWLGEIYEPYCRDPEWEETKALERQEELIRIRTKREEITRSSLTYYWWRFCRKRRITENPLEKQIGEVPGIGN